MIRIKRLDLYMLQRFLPLSVMTFLICVFIVLMQFLWQHIADLVGKGLGVDVLAELFFYAALSMVPLALPLSILLASLMTFGNIGESLELTAMKAGGISLFRVMRPLIVLMAFVSVGAFFFQNNVLPVAQTRMWTLLKSMKQKSPELDIVAGEFNYQLPNINIFIRDKNHDSGVLYDVMIYDVRDGFERSRVILADSAKLSMTADKTHMRLMLYKGELMENLRDAAGLGTARNQLYRREEFLTKEILLSFNANFDRMDESEMRSLYIGQNISQLSHSIDSIHCMLDSMTTQLGNQLASESMLRVDITEPDPEVGTTKGLNADKLYAKLYDLSPEQHERYLQRAQSIIAQRRAEYTGRSYYLADEAKVLRRHGVEMHKKFTLSLAVLVFFFIGAPLGAIIRKGGLGTPLVISVLLFIFYYIIDNSGMKMARDGKLAVWQGMWLSSAILLPLGILVTYKAVHDSAVFNADAYRALLRRITVGEHRQLAMKEVAIEQVDPAQAREMMQQLQLTVAQFLADYPGRQSYRQYWAGGYPSERVREIIAQLEMLVSYLSNTRSPQVLAKINALPILHNYRILHPAPASRWSRAFFYAVPAGAAVWAVALGWQRNFCRKLRAIDLNFDVDQ